MPEQKVIRNEALDRRILEFVLTATKRDPWTESMMPGKRCAFVDRLREFRLRYSAHRSVAQLMQDAKNEPFPNASNIGVGIEQVFGERLIPTFLANTIDLDPTCEAIDKDTEMADQALTVFHSRYQQVELSMRNFLQRSDREMLTVGSSVHKWGWGSVWKQREGRMKVLVSPLTKQPVMVVNQQSGEMEPVPVDPHMPEDLYPVDPQSGQKFKVGEISLAKIELKREGPRPFLRKIDQLRWPSHVESPDPDEWDWISEDFVVSPWWFLGREGDPMDGKLQLQKLWQVLKIDPNNVYERPTDLVNQQVKLREFHGKYPVSKNGKPIEIIALVATEHNLLLGWRVSPFPRRPYFIRQVWMRDSHPLGKGIPETCWDLRNAMDANLNQDLDSGNLYNHPPLLLSQFAMLDDEDYEQAGPGTRWVMSDINGAKFLPPPVSKRDPLAMLDWLMSMTQRIWGVTDFSLNAPSRSLSPNISTATGALVVQNEGNVKFSHLTKALETTRTQELQFVHDLFGEMLANPKTIVVNGQATQVRRDFFKPNVEVRAAGDGMTTNPAIRQQVHQAAYTLMMQTQNQFVLGDPETYKKLTQQTLDSMGVKITLKDPAAIEQLQLLQEVAQTPQGQMHLQAAIQEIQLQKQMQAQQAAMNGNGMSVSRQ